VVIEQSVSQQTESSQNPELHSLGVVQGTPVPRFGWQLRPSQ
jgi:hypothetical protein